ncbi:autotransporter outer membrane beta-barrel domain-containing protein [Bosea sp. (in: a-proteobacteria)]|uniref:autotransporter family protein n=1 Tax=Bosea sp. (in: a-proteobacteria) TaxID=1871050 RepID=UPI0031FEB436
MRTTALVALICAASGARPASAQPVTGSGDLIPGPAQTPNWIVGGDLRVGDGGTGQLDITAGGTVLNDLGYIAFGIGSIGTVTVSGQDGSGNRSTWSNANDLVIGEAGTGSLTITGGGVVNNRDGYIGADSTGVGTVTVSGVGSNGRASTWTNVGDLHVGYNGTGTLNILAGGQVSNVGGDISGGGNALVSGQGSSWHNSGRLTVGLYGTGTLRVEDGATISSADGIVGDSAQGDAVLTGAGTTWTNTGQFTVGSFGTGTLRIEDGATVTSNQGYIGASDTGSVTVSGAGSKWSMSPYSLTIGNFGIGSLTVENGGLVRAEGGVLLGVASISSGTLLLQGSTNNRGVLETSRIFTGYGTTSVTFNGGLLRATDDNPDFFAGFEGRTITIGANGVVIDTDGHDIGISPTFTGAGALIKDGPGKLTLTGDSGSTFTGAGSVVAGTLVVNGILGGTMEVIGGRLQGIGTVGATTNQPGGTIAPGNSIGTLTINGDYVGNGGQLEIETVLGGDASPSDRLVITGSTSGTTTVRVINQGGTGARTVEGIKIVDVGGASNGTFSLQGNYVFQGQQAVVAGAYAYTLHKNGVSTPNDGDWYLRSVYTVSSGSGSSSTGSSSISGSSATEASGDGASSAAAESSGTVVTPIYQPGASLYEAYGQVLQRMNQLQTLRQRVGERFDGRTGASSSMAGHAVWARIDGAHARVTPSFSTTGTGYTIDSWRLQIGVDGQLLANDSGILVGGLSLHHGGASADVSSVFGQGRIASRGSGFAGTLTWYGASGFYADAQAQFSWFDSDLSSTTTGRRLAKGKAGFGSVLGLELGQRFALAGDWSLTPQVQLSYARIDADSFVDPFGASVAVGHGDSLRGRLGLSADYRASWRDAGGRKVDMALYGIANLHYDFRGGTATMVADARLTSREERLQGGLGLGAKYAWDRYALYGEVEARTSLAHFADSHTIAGRAGLRISW